MKYIFITSQLFYENNELLKEVGFKIKFLETFPEMGGDSDVNKISLIKNQEDADLRQDSDREDYYP